MRPGLGEVSDTDSEKLPMIEAMVPMIPGASPGLGWPRPLLGRAEALAAAEMSRWPYLPVRLPSIEALPPMPVVRKCTPTDTVASPEASKYGNGMTRNACVMLPSPTHCTGVTVMPSDPATMAAALVRVSTTIRNSSACSGTKSFIARAVPMVLG